MTNFTNSKKQDQSSAASGKDFLAECREHLEDAVAECVATYDGGSVEDFANDIIEVVWEVEDADLKKSFKNGRDYRRSSRRSR